MSGEMEEEKKLQERVLAWLTGGRGFLWALQGGSKKTFSLPAQAQNNGIFVFGMFVLLPERGVLHVLEEDTAVPIHLVLQRRCR